MRDPARGDVARSFPPIAARHAHTLILGSMPGRDSLRAVRYYAHARNAFWPIVLTLLDAPPDLDYDARIALLRERGFALWDVLAECVRPGSLDASIDPASIVPNDIAGFLARHPHIGRIALNGGSAAALFRRHIAPMLPPDRDIEIILLPSTSPAHAGMPFAAKLDAWRVIGPATASATRG
ncbi:DNA-deoxyinosine glycosylase [Chiayiivirga flava]|uniref:Hypoxanthine-DNA glycosylase n=1 Tax=Chiayiivirga flava TaxID=659595 RepID=A0A7W8DA33_9GAMM|nr:DNA-deoxyinosine glycosylase [Chiayiivirga flava]MBB5209550.1 hypoxanthine-DNA glycosylase [Chiayiivirga flava]